MRRLPIQQVWICTSEITFRTAGQAHAMVSGLAGCQFDNATRAQCQLPGEPSHFARLRRKSVGQV